MNLHRGIAKDATLSSLARLMAQAKAQKQGEGNHALSHPKMQLSRRAVDLITEHPDSAQLTTAHYNTALSICRVTEGGELAMFLIKKMTAEAVKPTAESYSYAMFASATLAQTRDLWKQMQAQKITPCEHCYAALMRIIAKEALLNEAGAEETRHRLLQVFQRMARSGVHPDVRHYGNLLRFSRDDSAALQLMDFCKENLIGVLPLAQYFKLRCANGASDPTSAVHTVISWHERNGVVLERSTIMTLRLLLRDAALWEEDERLWGVHSFRMHPQQVVAILKGEEVRMEGLDEKGREEVGRNAVALISELNSRVKDFHCYETTWAACMRVLLAAGLRDDLRGLVHLFTSLGGRFNSQMQPILKEIGLQPAESPMGLIGSELTRKSPQKNVINWG